VEIIQSLIGLLGDPTGDGGDNAISTLIELAENGAFQPDISAASLKGDTQPSIGR
jgi:hypothetical protein